MSITFDAYAEQVAQASAEEARLSPAVLVPLILDVLPRVLACLKDRNADPVTVLTQASAEAVSDEHRIRRLGRRYYARSHRLGLNLEMDQAQVVAAHTIAAGRTVSAANLQSLTDLAMAMPKDIEA